MKVTAKEFSARTGFPLKLIRRMCRSGQLDHWQIGRRYYVDEEKALLQMELYKATPIYRPEATYRYRKSRQMQGNGSGTVVTLKDIIKKKKAEAAATATAKDRGKVSTFISPIRIIPHGSGG